MFGSFTIQFDDKFDGAGKQVENALRRAINDVVTDVAKEAIENSPVSDMYPSISKTKRTPTGNNRRSIMYEMGPGGELDLDDFTGAVYSTSGYGGYLETGTVKMPARPYMYPAAAERFTESEMAGRIQANLGDA